MSQSLVSPLIRSVGPTSIGNPLLPNHRPPSTFPVIPRRQLQLRHIQSSASKLRSFEAHAFGFNYSQGMGQSPESKLKVRDDGVVNNATYASYCQRCHMDIPKGDKLVLRGLKFHGYHGVNPEGRKLRQKFLVDVDAWMDLRPAGESDCLSDTLNYNYIYRIVKVVVEGQPRKPLEHVAELIASKILKKYLQVSAIRVQVGKPHVAVQGPVDYLGVEIIRHRDL